MSARISIIAAIGKNNELGREGQLLWSIPEDLKRFKQLTLGHPVIMGRKTFESIVAVLGRPLPGRPHIVITRSTMPLTIHDPRFDHGQVQVVSSLEKALMQAKELDQEEVFVIGGGEIYTQALPYADRLYLTLIDDEKEADTFFPSYTDASLRTTLDEPREWQGISYRFVTLEK